MFTRGGVGGGGELGFTLTGALSQLGAQLGKPSQAVSVGLQSFNRIKLRSFKNIYDESPKKFKNTQPWFPK